MFSAIRRILGAIKVEQRDTEITISGLPADIMMNDISKIWKTSRINAHMFTVTGRSVLSFPNFFAPDVVYMIDKLLEHRSTNTNARSLNVIKNLLLTETWLKDTNREHTPRLDYSKINNLIYKPLDYQEEFLRSYDKLTQQYHLNGYLLAVSAGGGKSYINLALAECLGMDRIVVVCPKNATERVWESETIKLFKKKQTYWVQQQGKPYNGERVVILHYEALEKVLDIVDKIKTKKCIVILDECHNLNEVNSKRTQLYHELIKALESKDIIYASGTAIKALGAEAIPLLRAIDPYFTEDAEQRFKKIYGANGVKGLDILQHRIGLVSFKVEKHQLGLDKPIIKRLPINIPNANLYTLPAIREDMRKFIEERWAYYNARKDSDLRFYNECLDIHKSKLRSDTETSRFNLYKGFVKDIQNANGDARFVADEMKWCNAYEKTDIIPNLPRDKVADFKSIKSTIKYTNLKIQGEALGRVLGRKRIECHVDMVPHVDFAGICGSTTKKTVVFTSFVEALEASEKYLTEIGMNPVVVYGKTNNELSKTVGLFEKDIDLNPLVATYQSLSTAVPLVMADTMIMLNAPFRAYIHEQAISRIHRLGADTQTIVWEAYLNTGETPNISTRSGDILQWSQQQVEAIMGIASPFEIEEGDGVITVANESLGISECVTVKEVMEKMKRKENSFLDW